jgi:hypothetical protein
MPWLKNKMWKISQVETKRMQDTKCMYFVGLVTNKLSWLAGDSFLWRDQEKCGLSD